MASIIIQSGPLAATGVLWLANVAQEDGVTLHVVDSGGGSTIVAEVSDDNSTWTTVGTITTTGRFFYAADNKYFRVRVSTYVSGFVRVGADATTVGPRTLLQATDPVFVSDVAGFRAAMTAGKSVICLPGLYNFTSGVEIPSFVKIQAAGGRMGQAVSTRAVVFRKSFSGNLLTLTGTDTTHRVSFVTFEGISFQGQGNTGNLITGTYVDHIRFNDCYFYDNPLSPAIDLTEPWDCYWKGCEFDHCGSATYQTGATIYIKSGATDSANQLYFSQCRWESHLGHALYINSTGTVGPYGIYLSQIKMESAIVGGPAFIDATADVKSLHISDAYFSATGMIASNPCSFISAVLATDLRLTGIHMNAANGALARGMTWYTNGKHSIDGLYCVGTPTQAWLGFDGGAQEVNIRGFTPGSGTAVSITSTAASRVSFADWGGQKLNSQTASYTLVSADGGTTVEMSSASANALTVPPNSSVPFPIGTQVRVTMTGAGVTTLTAGAGVTIRVPSGLSLTMAQYDTRTLRKRATDEWVLSS